MVITCKKYGLFENCPVRRDRAGRGNGNKNVVLDRADLSVQRMDKEEEQIEQGKRASFPMLNLLAISRLPSTFLARAKLLSAILATFYSPLLLLRSFLPPSLSHSLPCSVFIVGFWLVRLHQLSRFRAIAVSCLSLFYSIVQGETVDANQIKQMLV